MWKIIIFCVLSVAHAADIGMLYGTWTQIAFYPSTAYIPVCIQYVFDKDPKNTDCTCNDGKIAKLVELSMLLKKGNETAKVLIGTAPMIAVDSPTEATLHAHCTCGEKPYATRGVARIVNPNYFVMYEKKRDKQYTEAEPNNAYVFAKKVPNTTELNATLHSIEDLKNRRAAEMCASDVNLKE